ncbi:autotransporter outer membrane beta-barrel domain-containing protein [Sphingomonas crocodyli]|uniref:Autotransporter domain-containing protein n=1 Tax=Sphingomonas crocodyli TaxID=1979270 RepID=A0A437M0G1_9SPHN|nr:autotransporter outer membrane beta-barrel domain-containing protein [Sphingomonas crocodyli]RVT91189.1 hypothetical protein EOD43_16890 [Sphingomonas crocodyli]
MTKSMLLRLALLSGAACVGIAATPVVVQAQSLPTFTLDSSNSTVGTWSLSTTNLSTSVLSNPSTLTVGSNVFNYAAIFFNPAETARYTFNQTSAPVDTVMILYQGIFDPTRPGLNAIIGNDDTDPEDHQTFPTLGTPLCGGQESYCPQVEALLTSNQPITLVISTYSPNSPLNLPLTFYASGAGNFTADPGDLPDPVDPAVTTPTPGSSLPSGAYLDGGTLEMDGEVTADIAISDNGGTIDTAQGNFAISGDLTDRPDATGNGGLIVTGGNTLSLTGDNSFSGSTTLNGGSTLSVAGTNSLGTGGVTLDSGTLTTTAALDTNAAITLAGAGNVIDTGNNALGLGGGLTGTGDLTITGGNVVNVTGTSNNSGMVTLTGGTTLSVAGTNSLGSGGLTLNGGTLTTTAALDTSAAITVTGTSNVIDTGNNTLGLGGGLSGTGNVTITGGNIVNVTGASTNSGMVTLIGGTTLSVASTNSLGSGGLTLNGGTLTTTAALDTSAAITVTGTSNIIDTGNNALGLGGGLTGTGNVTIIGGNIVNVTGASNNSGMVTLTGGTTLSVAGTNSLGSGGLTLNGGTLTTTAALDTGAAITLTGASNVIDTGNNVLGLGGGLTGTGDLTILGGNVVNVTGASNNSGMVTLTGSTTLSVAGTNALGSGGLTLNGGTLTTTAALGTGTAITAAGSNNVIDTRNNVVMLGGGLAGSGALTITGGNTVALAGASGGFTGAVSLTGGTNLVVGSPTLAGGLSACSGITVGGNAILSGNGTVCTTTVNSTGILAPGNSPGTLTVAGNLTLNTGSILLSEVDGRTYAVAGGAGSYDRVVVTGAFVGNGTIAPVLRGISGAANNSFTPVLGDVFTIVTADTVSGNFQSIVQPTSGMSANTRFDVRYTPNSVQLVVTPASFATLANSGGWVRNARNAAAALDTVRPDAANLTGPLAPVFAGLYGLDANGLNRSVQQISGEIHAQALQASIGVSRAGFQVVREAAGDGFGGFGAQAPEHGRMWGQYIRYTSKHPGDANAGGYRSTNNGFAMGVSLAAGDKGWIGLAGSYVRNKVSTDIGASARSNVGAGYVYGFFRPSDAAQLTGVLGVSLASVKTRRTIDTIGAPATATSNKLNSSVMMSIDGRYRIVGRDGLSLWGTAGVDYSNTSMGRVGERAATPAYGLLVDRDTWRTAEARLGAQAQYGIGPALLSLSGNWLHHIGDLPLAQRTVHLGAASWQVQGVGMDRNGFNYGAAIRTALGERITAQVSYERTDHGRSFKTDRVAGGLSLAF